MSRVKLTIATTDYDLFRDFRLGIVSAEGIDHTWLTLGHHEVFARFTFNREWEVSELSFAKFCAQVTRKTPDIIGLPVVCSRLFRFSSFYVNKRSKIKTAADLKGKTIGSPEWAHTAAVYMRGWLNDEHGIGLRDIHWYQAGANEPGRVEKVELDLPKGVKLTRINDKSLSEMIASGEIDCALIARPPNSFLQRHPDVVRLFPNYLEMEETYYEQTKVWPIMHIIAIQRRVVAEHPRGPAPLSNAVLGSEGRRPGGPRRTPRLALSARLASELCAQDVRPVRRRPFSVRHRREPADTGAVSALHPRAGDRTSSRRARGDFSQGHHDFGQGVARVRSLGSRSGCWTIPGARRPYACVLESCALECRDGRRRAGGTMDRARYCSKAANCALPTCRARPGRLHPATMTRCRSSHSWRENRDT